MIANNSKIRYFVSIETGDELKALLVKPDLHDPRFLIKTYYADGTCKLVPIINIKNFNDDDVLPFAQKIGSKNGNEVVFEITRNVLKGQGREFPSPILLTEIAENKYHETRPVQKKQLIEYGARKYMQPEEIKACQVVTLMPTEKMGKSGFTVSYKRGLLTNNGLTETQKALEEIAPGAGFYLVTTSLKVLDDYRSWITEITQEQAGFYTLSARNYYFIKRLSETELNSMPLSNSYYYRQITKNKVGVLYDSQNEDLLNNDQVIKQGSEEYYPVRREEVEPLLVNGIQKNPFKDIILVFTQNADDFTKGDLTEALDPIRTVIRSYSPDLSNLNAEKINTHLLYEWNPRTPIPKVFTKREFPLEILELNYIQEDNNEILWEPATKQTMRKHKGEFTDDFEKKGNRCFIRIPIGTDIEILEQLEASGQTDRIKEFEMCEIDGKPFYLESKKTIDIPKTAPSLTT